MTARSTPVEPKPAASVLLVRPAQRDAPEPFQIWMIRRQKTMRFLGGYYAFPGGRVDAADSAPESLARCYGLSAEDAETIFPGAEGAPALAYWVTAARELLEECGLLLACDGGGRPIDAGRAAVVEAIDRVRKRLMAGESAFAALLAAEGWQGDARPLRYLSHFITPARSPIRFSARFFLCPLPEGQAPRLFTEEASEGFWIVPAEGYRRCRAGEMRMAEPAEYALGYLAQFDSLAALWAAHADRRHKFHGINHRL